MGRGRILLASLALVVTLASATNTGAAPARLAPPPVIAANGFMVAGPFKAFVEANGGLERFGPPLTGELHDAELALPVQYFTFARLEHYGETVRLSRLGSLRAAGQEASAPFLWLPVDTPLEPGRRYVPESGHTLGGAFAWYHAAAGGVPLLGLPISEEHLAPQPDGSTLLVQFFERALLTYHPGPAGEGEVRREPLGVWLAEARTTPAQRTPGPGLAPLATASAAYSAGTPWGHNIELATARLDGALVAPGGSLGFLGAIGEISAAAGYRPGPAVVGGEVVADAVGGGICTVATLLYRAAWAAGLPIPERRGHSRWLAAFADPPGLDAAVAQPGPDLRVHNDTGQPLFVAVRAVGGVVTLTIWGIPDGRAVALAAPVVRESEGWIEVQNSRLVRDHTGRVQLRERVITSYRR